MLLRVLSGIFLILHGLVHLLYLGQSIRLFELQPGMIWPDESWVFSGTLGISGTRVLANIGSILAAALFVIGGIGILLGQAWWRTPAIVAATLSGVLYILLWDGRFQHLDNQGGVGLLINIAILVSVLLFKWPRFDF
jgi:uncharacterized membrane protein YphA (DoxX/SURF4 family)